MGTPTRRAVLGGVAAAAGLGALATPAAAGPQRGRFAGKVVLITGATSGIGEATARAFAAAGARVAFCGRRANLGRAVEHAIRSSGGEATYIQADVREPSSVQHFVDSAVRRYGRLDIAFNNAGVQISAPLHKVTVEQWDDVTDTNARGVFLSMKYQIPHMLATGGHIIVNSSVGAVVGRPGLSTYQATKQAVQALVKSAALEYGGQGIRVNAILPGITDTAMIRPAGLDDATWQSALVFLGQENVDGLKRTATPAMIASAVLGLAGDEFAYLTGASVPVDGGIAAGRRMIVPPMPA
ncbi:SDR family NAD(P)-dependent oxidoreductase [Kibdelosporangium persicum]|uniref:NADP-dependent 3-hydroxy acid dehydrogenase YdfG n=1 Tax=Kibdelosporangium persicum TaxID=2698649 RepID=A0ABX2F177_9PSEU|nr:SDR family oxidoreductase [Kibdelosporangium persicum]NRN64889.1 NADP-dependent 3-hydroxy acid dehydrogenase YdfG [Kibdelosporangium persicum]